jgi:hypothetical protein
MDPPTPKIQGPARMKKDKRRHFDSIPAGSIGLLKLGLLSLNAQFMGFNRHRVYFAGFGAGVGSNKEEGGARALCNPRPRRARPPDPRPTPEPLQSKFNSEPKSSTAAVRNLFPSSHHGPRSVAGRIRRSSASSSGPDLDHSASIWSATSRDVRTGRPRLIT